MRPARRRSARLFLSALTAFAVIGSVLIPATGAFAAEQAAVRNTKTVSVQDVSPGDTFNWMIEVGCSVLTDECVNAVLTDTIPSEFIPPAPGDILLTPALSAAERTISVSGQTVTIEFLQDLVRPVGEKGLNNITVTVTIPVTVRSDLDYTPTARTVTNTAEMVADNATMRPSEASVDLLVPIKLATQPAKSFSPSTNIAVADLTTELTLQGVNTSNTDVSTLTIQDPVDPTAATNIFTTALELTTLDSATWPAGATSAVVSLWDLSLSAWVDAPPVSDTDPLLLPPGVSLANAGGIRVVFSSTTADIPRNASAGMVLSLKNRVGVPDATYTNTVQSVVTRDTFTATAQDTATYVVTAATSEVSAGKSITPDRLSTKVYGATDLTQGTVTLTGANAGSISLDSLTISEPSDPTLLLGTNPLAPAHTGGGLIFSGFTGDVEWPAGATAAFITYYFTDGSSEVIAATAPGLPDPIGPERVTGFSVTFTGEMAATVVATVPFTVTANPAQVAPDLSVPYLNEVSVTGIDKYATAVGPATATDTVAVLAEQVSIETSKTRSRANLRAAPGQTTTATLTTHVLDYPDSTRSLDHIEMIDPSDESNLTEWYKYFNPTRLVVTAVPGDATLTVSYRDSAGVYQTIPSLTGILPGVHPELEIPVGLRDSIHGLKLSWDTTAGFVPDQSLVVNIEYALRSELRGEPSSAPLPNAAKVLENCSASSGTAGVSPSELISNVATSNPCPKVTLVPYDDSGTGGGANLLEKRFIRTNSTNAQGIMNTRNSERTRARLSWSTDAYTGVSSMVIYDGAVDSSGDPDPSTYSRGMYDAYDLYEIPDMSAIDTLMQYDAVSVRFYSKSNPGWVELIGYCTQAAPCDGGVGSAHTLTDLQRADYLAVEFTFTEGTNRPGLSPAPGSGVADSLANNRHIDLVFQMRETLRSDSTWPVVNGYRYNAPLAGSPAEQSVIRNDAHAEATLVAGGATC